MSKQRANAKKHLFYQISPCTLHPMFAYTHIHETEKECLRERERLCGLVWKLKRAIKRERANESLSACVWHECNTFFLGFFAERCLWYQALVSSLISRSEAISGRPSRQYNGHNFVLTTPDVNVSASERQKDESRRRGERRIEMQLGGTTNKV